MATNKQLTANGRTALSSTGPTSSAGKAAVRFNSLRHGLRAQSLILPGESPEEFDSLRNGLEEGRQTGRR